MDDSSEGFENSPLLFRRGVESYEDESLGEEDTWSSDTDEPMDSQEEEYLSYGEGDDDSRDDTILMGLDEDYQSEDVTTSDEFISEDEIADVSAFEYFVHNCFNRRSN